LNHDGTLAPEDCVAAGHRQLPMRPDYQGLTMPDLRTALKQCPVVAILRGVKPDEIDAVGDALVEAGIVVIEVPLNSPDPFDSIGRLARRHGARALIGAGTVLETPDIARVKDAGGQLIVAPNFDADVVRATKACGPCALPGVMTPSEGFAALKAGADGLKLFPAEIIPPAVFRAWRAVFPADAAARGRRRRRRQHRGLREAGAPATASAPRSTSRAVAAEIGKLARALVAVAKA
jgi:2-dehydro-3-deoxyphosphogalactonate aldolase